MCKIQAAVQLEDPIKSIVVGCLDPKLSYFNLLKVQALEKFVNFTGCSCLFDKARQLRRKIVESIFVSLPPRLVAGNPLYV